MFFIENLFFFLDVFFTLIYYILQKKGKTVNLMKQPSVGANLSDVAARAELRETAAEPVPWEQVKADLGLA